jgi:hypothetical protein
VLDNGALQLDLMGYRGDRATQHVVRFDFLRPRSGQFEQNGTLRQRIWSLEGAERVLIIDVQHRKVAP